MLPPLSLYSNEKQYQISKAQSDSNNFSVLDIQQVNEVLLSLHLFPELINISGLGLECLHWAMEVLDLSKEPFYIYHEIHYFIVSVL